MNKTKMLTRNEFAWIKLDHEFCSSEFITPIRLCSAAWS